MENAHCLGRADGMKPHILLSITLCYNLNSHYISSPDS